VYRGSNGNADLIPPRPPGVYKTTNAGDTWSTSPIAPQDAIWISISPLNGNIAWWVDDTRAYKTTDDGATWSIVNPFPPGTGTPTKILAHPTQSNTAFVTVSGYAAGAHVLRTTGVSWTNVTGNLRC
jgi:photosystem II stability/assembly factor-like uncharacterized protein